MKKRKVHNYSKVVVSRRHTIGQRHNLTAPGGHVKTSHNKIPKPQIEQIDFENE